MYLFAGQPYLTIILTLRVQTMFDPLGLQGSQNGILIEEILKLLWIGIALDFVM
jgi:hypothetical protein